MGIHKRNVVGHHAFRFIERDSLDPIKKGIRQLRKFGSVKNLQCRYRTNRGPIDVVVSASVNNQPRKSSNRLLIVSHEMPLNDTLSKAPLHQSQSLNGVF